MKKLFYIGKAKLLVFEGFAFVAGFCGIAFEYTFSKFSADLLGSSAQQWALVIGFMLLAMGIGSDHQKKIPNSKLMQRFFFYEVLLSTVGGLGPIALLATFSVARMYYMPVLFLFVFAVGFFIGTEIPILARLNQSNRSRLQENLAGVFRVEYLGGFAGAMVWAFVIVRVFPNMLQAALFVAGINLLAAASVMCFFLLGAMPEHPSSQPAGVGIKINGKKSDGTTAEEGLFAALTTKQIALAGASFWFVLIALLMAYFMLPRVESFYEQKLFRDKIIASHSTPYQHIVATESHAKVFNLYINGQLQLSSLDEYIYHETLVHPAMLLTKKREEILILGGGDGMALREVLRYRDVKKVVLVDIDFAMLMLASSLPQLVEMNEGSLQSAVLQLSKAKTHGNTTGRDVVWPNISKFPVKNSEGILEMVEVRAMDAVAYLQGLKSGSKFNVVIIDFPDPDSVEVSKLYSLSFYASLKKHLHPNAVVVQQATSSFLTKETFLLVGNTMAKAGFATTPLRVGIPSFGEWGFWMGRVSMEELGSNDFESSSRAHEDSEIATLISKNFKQYEKNNAKVMNLRYVSLATIPGFFAFPPGTFSDAKNDKLNKTQSNTKTLSPTTAYNTVVNHLIYRTYLRENRRY